MSELIQYPRVLIISHNALSMTNNMGKTLVSYFRSFPKDHLAQLYFHEGVPHSNICSNYYSFSDKDALKSVINRFCRGTIYRDIEFDESSSSIITGALYTAGKTKNPIVSYARDFIWRISHWKNKQMINWIREFSPEVIFYASGDYCFSYRIARYLSNLLNLPLVTCCFDDFYLYCAYENKIFGKAYYNHFLKVAKNTIYKSEKLFTVNDLMSKEYEKFFGKKSSVLYTAANISETETQYESKHSINYIGGLALNRQIPIVEIGRLMKSGIDGLEDHINVYSAESRKEILDVLVESNGIKYKGSIGPIEVRKVIEDSLAVIHVESFDNNNRSRTRLSLSTKIAESLGSGTILIAYGPSELASMQYLRENNVAIVADNITDLKKKICETLIQEDKYNEMVERALNLARKNHSSEAIQKTVVLGLNEAIRNYGNR